MEDQKAPSHIEAAAEFMEKMFNMDHKEQLEVFTYIRKNLLERRKEQQESINKYIAEANQDLERHVIGSNTIASGL